jgi:zinc protease
MVFKGTDRFPKGVADKTIAGCGGVRNGMTWVDYTAYYETMPSRHIDIAIAIEADRMTNARFLPDEVASERGVVISEREGSENQPGYALFEETSAAAYKLHAYGQPVVGYKHDLRTMTRDTLFNHYRKFYVPNNAIVVAVGDFDTDEMVSAIDKEFGPIPRGADPSIVAAVEPVQEGERRVTVRRPGPVPILSQAYHVPANTHPDTPALWLLGAVLSAGRSSRLYTALVTTGLAQSAGAGSSDTRDPYLFRVSVTSRSETDPPRLEAATIAVLEQLAQDGVTDSELTKVRRQFRAGYVFGSEGVTNQARSLGQHEISDTWRRADTYLAELDQVTAKDVQRVCATYLVERNRTTGWFLPEGDSR